MKKLICLLLALLLILSFAACGEEKKDESNDNQQLSKNDNTGEEKKDEEKTLNIDIDLTAYTSTLAYAEVVNMMTTPENYKGKTVKMKGAFKEFHFDDAPDNHYFSCEIADTTACCSQYIEFTLKDDKKYPDDYPSLNTEITVTGVFETYKEGSSEYVRLKDATIA